MQSPLCIPNTFHYTEVTASEFVLSLAFRCVPGRSPAEHRVVKGRIHALASTAASWRAFGMRRPLAQRRRCQPDGHRSEERRVGKECRLRCLQAREHNREQMESDALLFQHESLKLKA